jgi:hypothetical protein
MPRHLLLAVFLMAACDKDEAQELDCNNDADDDGDGDVDCADADCAGTLSCEDGDTDDTDTGGGDTDTDTEFVPDTLTDVAGAKLTGETLGDRAGFSLAGGGDVTGDGSDDIVVGAYLWDDENGDEVGQVYVVSGAPTGDVPLATADALVPGIDADGEFGHSVAIVGDVTGDGNADLLVGGRRAFATRGMGYVVPGPLTGTVDLSTVAWELRGEENEDSAGWSVASAGDVNADGVPDVLVGADRNDDGGADAGRAYLVLGPIADDFALGSLTSTQGARYNGADPDDRAGRAVSSAGDVDGDGNDDVLVGAFNANGGGADRGAAYLVYQPTLGVVDLADADGRFFGKRDYAYAGDSLTRAGDLDGDGYDDVAVGAYGSSESGTESGSVYVWAGSATRYSGDYELNDGTGALNGESAFDRLGFSFAGAGDLNGDGNDDLVVGAFGYDRDLTERGAVYIVPGPIVGDSDVDEVAIQTIMGEGVGDQAGHRVASGGDLDGDGSLDVLVGAYPWSGEQGAVYTVLGGGW